MFNLTKEEYAVATKYNLIPTLDHIRTFCSPDVQTHVLLEAYDEIMASINPTKLYNAYRNVIKLDGVTLLVIDMDKNQKAMERIGMPEVMMDACSVQLDGLDILIVGHRSTAKKEDVHRLIHHELIHIQQYRQGRLKPMTPTTVLWDNVMYVVYRPEDGAGYYSSPWEVEAYAKVMLDCGVDKFTSDQQTMIDRYALMTPTKDIDRNQLING